MCLAPESATVTEAPQSGILGYIVDANCVRKDLTATLSTAGSCVYLKGDV